LKDISMRMPMRPGVALGLFLTLAGVARPQGAAPRAPSAAPVTQAAAPRPQSPAPTEAEAAVRASMAAFAKAYASRDATMMASLWTEGGELKNDSGVSVRGRDALRETFGALLAKAPSAAAEVETAEVRFLSPATAVAEGRVTVRAGAASAPSRARFRALLVREPDGWRLAELSETAEAAASVRDLEWLVGEWKSVAGQGAEILTSYGWDANKKFLLSRFTLKEKTLQVGGTQVIGVDPATSTLHSWTFEASGGVAEADWSRDGDHWVLDATGTLADGRTLTETNVLRRIDNDTFTWQSIDRQLDDEPLADLPPVKVTRVRAAAAK
jgi:uncharacterized protein (TIGR02246 family)